MNNTERLEKVAKGMGYTIEDHYKYKGIRPKKKLIVLRDTQTDDLKHCGISEDDIEKTIEELFVQVIADQEALHKKNGDELTGRIFYEEDKTFEGMELYVWFHVRNRLKREKVLV